VKRILHSSLVLLALSAVACSKGGDKSAAGAASAKTLTIAVIPKGTSHEFWKSIHAGAVQASQELTAAGDSVKIIWKGPLRGDDRDVIRPQQPAQRSHDGRLVINDQHSKSAHAAASGSV